LMPKDDQLHIEVRDQGRGYNSDQVTAGSQGLLRIRQRLQLIGGQMQVQSGSAIGTCVILYIPLHTPIHQGS